jgi:hypothetical protein
VIDASDAETGSTEPASGVSNTIHNAPSPPPEAPSNVDTPAVASSLAALKNDSLERRASKRFSTYTFSKMTGGSTRGAGGSRRSMAAPASALTAGELAVLTEAAEDEEPEESRNLSRNASPFKPPPVPPLPASANASRAPSPAVATVQEPSAATTITALPAASGPPGAITVFLQVGREVKKATIESALSLSSLRILFMDKFSYNPGQDNFPAIYIRDPSSGIQYQLEDMEEVKDKCLLSLNIEREIYLAFLHPSVALTWPY